MAATTLEADYLIIGAGAMGMAFADVLITETDATMVIVDRHHQPGGHWNNAYPFVRLHQPSAFYGVNSRPLGSGTIDSTGWNAGFAELATGSEVCAYFDQVMQQQFLSSGRVQYFPLCDYAGDSRIVSLASGDDYAVKARKIVDATYMNVMVPSVTGPLFDVDDGVACVPPNGLVALAGDFRRYVVVGAGKTGMDACLFLLKNGVDPDAISWIMPRDSWMLDRASIQPGNAAATSIGRAFSSQMSTIAQSTSVQDMFERFCAEGLLLRLDDTVWPTMYRCATVTTMELEQLRRIKTVIRMGHVQRIEPDRIILDGGTVPTDPHTLHINCTADGLARRPAVPVFQGDRITLQAVRVCQQVFSAAFIGHLEAAYADEDRKNELAIPVPHPDSHHDFIRVTLANSINQAHWMQDPKLFQWLAAARLDGFTGAILERVMDPNSGVTVESLGATAATGTSKLQAYLAEIDAAE